MVPTDKVESFLKSVRELYYSADPRRAELEKHSLFVTKPGGGAAIFLED
jgi:N-acetylgalactosamine kinase